MSDIERKNSPASDSSTGTTSADVQAAPSAPPNGAAHAPSHSEGSATHTDGTPRVTEAPPPAAPPVRRSRKWLLGVVTVAALAVGGYFLVPWVETTLNTESTDDAYVNGHVTFVAPRVSGKVAKVFVDDNYRVKKGDLLVQLDKEPFAVQVALKRGAVRVAEKNLVAAKAQARGLEAQLGSYRWKLQNASEQVNTQVAKLRAAVATLNSSQAKLRLAESNLRRAQLLLPKGGLSKEDFDMRQQSAEVSQAAVLESLQQVYALRVGLGLPAKPPEGRKLDDAPADIDQTSSSVREALASAHQLLAQLGLPLGPTEATPKQAIESFQRLDKEGNLDRLLRDLIPNVPAVMQTEALLQTARHDLEQAELNLRYCDIVSDIDGVVTSRNINPGNYVQTGQQLMAVRSIAEIWIDCNFKETQLAQLRIGQRVRCEVDMYGSHKEFEGRITGFTMGTGQTLALLPPQNATGNFVKIIQRLPVRVELTDYDPGKNPLFVGLSVTPYVYYKEPPTGPHAGEILQPRATEPNRDQTSSSSQRSSQRSE